MKYSLLSIFCFVSFILFAQNESNYQELAQHRHNTYLKSVDVVPSSPQAASFGKYGEFPVNLYTGAVDISVPIYAISGRELSFPVTLKYNSGGVRVNELTSWVGAGWDIPMGGVITRSVQGEADLKDNYYDRGDDIATLNSTTYSDFYHDRHKLQQEASGVVGNGLSDFDTQPDHYNFTFPGSGGKFYLLPDAYQHFKVDGEDDNGDVVLFKKSMDYIIKPTFNTTGEIDEFLIIDNKGTRYHYTIYEETESIPEAAGGDVFRSSRHRSAWYLTEIESADLVEEIVISYGSTPSFTIPMNTYDGDAVSIGLPNESQYDSPNGCQGSGGNPCNGNINPIFGGATSVKVYNKRTLTQVDYLYNNSLDTRLVFTIDDYNGDNSFETEKLEKIEVRRGTGATLTDNIVLRYYNGKKRLFLEEVDHLSSDFFLRKGKTNFTYHATELPDIPSNAIDHWGYYNGHTLNTGLVPNFTDCNGNSYTQGANRSANSNALAGSLKTISYPTGGYTDFTFEPHVVRPIFGCWNSNQNTTVGGLRIAEVKSYTAPGELAFSKSYTYKQENSTTSSGVLINGLKFFDYEYYTNEADAYLDPCAPGNYYSRCKFLKISANPRATQSASEGEHVGYSRVVEHFRGSTVYNFKVSNGGRHYYDPTNGEVTKIEHYDDNDVLVQEKEFTYASDVNENRRTRTFKVPVVEADQDQDNMFRLCVHNNGQAGTWQMPNDPTSFCNSLYSFSTQKNTKYSTSYYDLKEYWGYAKSSTITNYLTNGTGNQPVVQTKTFTYDDIEVSNPTKMNFTGSASGDDVELRMRYPTDQYYYYVISSTVKNSMVDKNIIGSPIEVLKYRGSTQVDGTRMVYDLFSGHPYLKRLRRFQRSWTATGSIASGPDYGWETTATINSYSTGKVSSSYKRGWSSITNVFNNGYLTSTSTNGFTKQFEYDNKNRMDKQTDVDGQSIYYTYDNLQRLNKILSLPKGSNPSSSNPNDFYVVTDYDYQYHGSNNTINQIDQEQIFTSVSGSNLTSLQTKQWFDGLGRDLQTVKVGYSPAGKDVATGYVYNADNQLSKELYPVESAHGNGQYVANTTVPGALGSVKAYDGSPLSRVVSQTPPDWYASTTTYKTNSVSVSVDGTTYPPNTLFVNEVDDPTKTSWKTVTYTDKLGRLIMKRTEGDGNTLDTKYGYDQKDRLSFVLPPGVTSKSSNLAYRYLYDGRDRVIEKHIPDQGTLKMFYNERDLLSFSQDPNMSAAGKWMHYKYDVQGREISTGFTTATPTTGKEIYNYSELLTETEYDGDGSNPIEKGKVTFEKTKILGSTSDYLTTTTSYDQWGRVSQQQGTNHANGTELTTFTYDWAGNVLTEIRTHVGFGKTTIIEKEYTYDNGGRLDKTYLKITKDGTAGPKTLIAENDYTFKDELKTLHLGRTSGYGNFLQKVDYEYNPTGFLTKINGGALASNTASTNFCGPLLPNGAATSGVDGHDLFALRLYYDSPTRGGYSPANKNGNIAQMDWQVRGRHRQSYAYMYDFAGRLTNAYYGEASTTTITPTHRLDYYARYTYDERGNIKTLDRWGGDDGYSCNSELRIDDLDFNYAPDSNRLNNVQELSTTTLKSQGVAGTTYYTYDANGNQKTDSGKGLTYTYNHLNLPSQITGLPFGTISNTYTATGQKLVTSGTTTKTYVGGIEYVGSNIRAIYHEHGRVYYATSSSAGRYEYTIKDHLGNNRVTFTDKDGNGEITQSNNASTTEVLSEHHYYPFGMEMNGPWLEHEGDGSDYVYNGKELNKELGLYDYGARWYDPAVGRFTVVDAMADDLTQVDKSPYAYAWNDPVSVTDPDGNCPWCWGAVAGAVTDYGLQVAGNFISGKRGLKAFTDVDANSIKVSTLAGAASGGLSMISKLKKAKNLAQLAAEATVDGAGSAANQYVTTGEVSITEAVADGVVGAVVGRATGAAGVHVAKNTSAGKAKAKQLQTQVRRTSNRAKNRAEIAANGGRPRPAQAAAARKAESEAAAQGAGAGVGAGVSGSGVTGSLIDVKTPNEQKKDEN